MRSTFLKFGDRLRYLCENHVPAIKNSRDLARTMYKEGIIKYPDDCKDKEERHNYAARTIDIHLKAESAEGIKGMWIKRYCDFFQCSADFLFGYITLPTHEETDIEKVTGLSGAAIEILKKFNHRNSKYEIHSLNCLLINDDFARLLLHLDMLINYRRTFEGLNKIRRRKIEEAEKERDPETGAFNPPSGDEALLEKIKEYKNLCAAERIDVNDYFSYTLKEL